MDIQGKIIAVLETRSGVSATGTQWQVASYVLETGGMYPKKMVFEVYGPDRIAQMNIRQGEELKVYFDVDAREWNGKWFNSIKAWKVERPGAGQTQQPVPQQTAFPEAPAAPAVTQQPPQSGDDDLPF